LKVANKVANKVGIRKFSKKEKVDHLRYLLDLIAILVYSDPLCLDDTNKIFSENDINKLLKLDWQKVDQKKKNN